MSKAGADVVIIGSGITGALTAQWLTEHTRASVLVVEAGRDIPFDERFENRRRFLDYSEWPWPRTKVGRLFQLGEGAWQPHMLLGGMATHWGAQAPRYHPECFRLRSLFGESEDWPISYDDLEPWYCEAENRIGVAGDSWAVSGPPRSRAYPMPPMPINYNLDLIQKWTQRAGIATYPRPFAINSVPYNNRPPCVRYDSCRVCPSGAKFSPDILVRQLAADRNIGLLTETLAVRLETDQTGQRIVRVHTVSSKPPHSASTIEGKVFVLAGGTVWAPYLLLLSANEKFPDGLANRSGMVGRYIVGHHAFHQRFSVNERLVPEIHLRASLTTEEFMRPRKEAPLSRFDMELSASRQKAMPVGSGDEVMSEWKARTRVGVVSVSSFRETIPHRESRVCLDKLLRTQWGTPLPRISLLDDGYFGGSRSEQSLLAVGERLANAGAGRSEAPFSRISFDHRSGGCRCGIDPNTSVCDPWGRCHDHENLFISGAPLAVTGGTTNSTLTFCALALRTAAYVAKMFAT